MSYLCQLMKIGLFSIYLICIAFIVSSCNNYSKVLKSSDYDFKYEKAKEYYNLGQYSKATPLFEELIGVFKGTKSLEKIYYFYAYSLYAQRNHLLSEFYFKNFHEFYPKSPMAEDALFMVAYNNYQLSPKDNLDQTYTNKAIELFQVFINTYPESDLVKDANIHIDELRDKMELKEFNNAKLYYNLQQYKAASLAFENLLQKFPDTRLRDDAFLFILKSNYAYAKNSVELKKVERFENTMELYNNYVNKMSDLALLKEAEKLYTLSENYIKKNQ